MGQSQKTSISLWAGVACLILAFVMSFLLNMPTVKEKSISFSSEYDGKEVTLKGSYWQGRDGEYAVLICPGYSCDRQKWRPMADLCVGNGFSVMTFDYSGQGASMGTIGFDNAKTDRIPVQIADAIEELHRLSGVDYEHIILLGHSMGGRSILRLLYDYNNEEAQTVVEPRNIGNVILLSPEVNYHFNAQASLFAGTSDETQEPWKSYTEKNILGTNVYLFGSTEDDIVCDEDVLAIYRHLGGRDVPEGGKWSAVQTNASGSKLTVHVTGGVLHSYQMYSPKFATYVNEALSDLSGKAASYPAWMFRFIYGSWILGLIGLFLVLKALGSTGKEWPQDQVPVLKNAKKYLIGKLCMWIPGTVAAFFICCLCVCMPFGSPVMNIPYMCFIAGYGLVMLFAYRKGCFAGSEGKLPGIFSGHKPEKKELLRCVIASLLLIIFVWYVLRASMYRLIPWNARVFWLIIATALMTVGYFVSGVESDMLNQSKASGRVRLLYNLIQYVPLFLLVGFYLVIGSYSGMIGQAQNMLLMYIFCIPLGDFIKKVFRNRFAGALVTAFLFQTLMITSAALISMF